MKIKASELLKLFKKEGLLQELRGKDGIIERLAPVEECRPGDLVFVEKEDFIPPVLERKPTAVVTTEALSQSLPGFTLLVSPAVSLAHARIKSRFGDRDLTDDGWDSVHPSAIIHESATVEPGCKIGPGVVISRDVFVGEGTVIRAGAILEEESHIGKRCVIHSRAVVGWGCRVGEDSIIKSGAVIGSEGFGFAQDEKRKSHRIPQTGIVVIGKSVVVGANCCIDRAAYRETRLGDGVKLDNLCHIAHNVEVGEDTILTAATVVAGSTKIGKRVITSGQTGILDHLSIADDTIFLHRAGVIEDVSKPGLYAGLPASPLAEYMKNLALYKKLGEIRKRLSSLEKRVPDNS